MATLKTETVTFRITPGVKRVPREAAEQEHRSMANMIEVIIRDYCGRQGVPIPKAQGAPHRGSAA